MSQSSPSGRITFISGPVVRAELSQQLTMAERVAVGHERLAAEVIELGRQHVTLQVYEETAGLRLNEPIFGSGRPLSVLLGPGLIGETFDGIQRPLDVIFDRTGIFIERAETPSALDLDKEWAFKPAVEPGERVGAGTIIGTIQETSLVEHRIPIPPDVSGKVVEIVEAGNYPLTKPLARLEDEDGQHHEITATQRWPVRLPRPITGRKPPKVPLITGQRVIDSFFPVAKGGTASIPGPFGSGKTVMQHSLAKWSDADIIVYVGCGERGNEMTQVLEEFPGLMDPWSGESLMARTILIANTSNMPVAARESSIYTGLTMAEYYRDQGYDVALMADSTSRWAEALREISGRLEEMPAEEGFPAYLPSRLAAFYERAGRVETLGGDEASVTIVGAVSPPGGDFSEPVTRHTQRFTRCFWALDRELANARHYPAISWLDSYSRYLEEVESWWNEQFDRDWTTVRKQAMQVLQDQADLQQIVELVGPGALADAQRWILTTADLLKEGFLQQNAFSEIDAYAVPEKQLTLLSAIVDIHEQGRQLVERGVPHSTLEEAIQYQQFVRLKNEVPNDDIDQIGDFRSQVEDNLNDLKLEYQVDLTEPVGS